MGNGQWAMGNGQWAIEYLAMQKYLQFTIAHS